MSEKFDQLKIMQEMFPNATFVDANGERVADTSKTIVVEKEVYEDVLRNSVKVADLDAENYKLKELLKECREYIVNTPVYPQGDDNKQAEIHILVDKINEVLK
jgi:hypothetical protein